MHRDMAAMMRWGDIEVGLQAEGVSWSTDVADDMTRRVIGMFREAMDVARVNGFFDTPSWDDDDDDVPDFAPSEVGGDDDGVTEDSDG